MSATPMHLGLPDPATKPEFYDGVLFKRALAWLFDVVMIGIICAIIVPFTAFTALFFFPFLMLVIGFTYRWFTIAGKSSTWGMRLMGIELRDHNGLRLQSGTAFAHTFGYTASVAMAPLQLISVLTMIVTPRKQGLIDHLLGTAAINRPNE
ncbi:RDD family protein [Yoonia sp. MH D7]